MTNASEEYGRSAVRTDRILAAAVSAAAFLVYTLTLAPTVSFWDSGEYITCAWVAGIPHPPGVPFFVLTGRFATLLFSFIPEVAARVNLMCALAGSAAVGILSRLLQRWCRRMNYGPGFYRPVALAGGLLAAFSYTIWRNSNAAETYAMALLLTSLILWVFDLWIERRLRGLPAGRQLLLVGYLMTLSVGNHLSALIVVGPIVLMYVLYALRRKAFEWRSPGFILSLVGLMLLAFSVHLFMPVRAIRQPEINETDPSRYTAFREALERKQYGQVSVFARKGPFGEQLSMYAEYYSWQIGRPEAWRRLLGPGAETLGTGIWIFCSLSVAAGLAVLAVRRRDLLFLVGGTFFMASLAFVIYLNFKTGPEGTLTGEVRERDYFFGAAFAFSALLAALGAGAGLSFLWERKGVWALLLLPLAALGVNWHHCDRSGDFAARDYGVNLLESCAPGAVLITNGDNDTFPLWFAQNVLGVRRDVVVSNLSLMNTPWYTRQLMARDPVLLGYPEELVDSLRPVFIWGPNFFHVSQEGMPVTSEADRTALDHTFTNAWPWSLIRGELCVTVPSMGEGVQGSLAMQDLLLLKMVKRIPVHGRPVFLAGTVSRENRVYLEDYLSMEGIAYRVMDRPTPGRIDPERSLELAENYLYTGFDDPGVYKDDQAAQIARSYLGAWSALANHYLAVGDAASARYAIERGPEIFATMPREWLTVFHLHIYTEARLTAGERGPGAAAGYVCSMADSLETLAEEYPGYNLEILRSQLLRLSDELLQQQALLNFADSLSDGTPVREWLPMEIELSFGNYLGARNRMASLKGSFPGDPVLPVMEATLDRVTADLSAAAMIYPHETALAEALTFLERETPPEPGEMVLRMVNLASRGRVVTAACLGEVLSSLYPERGAAAGEYAGRLIADPETQRERAFWFSRAVRSLPPEAVRDMCLRNGLPELAVALETGR